MLRAILAVNQGEAIFNPAIAKHLMRHFATFPAERMPAVFPELTDPERVVLDLIAQGRSNTEIATRLVLSW